MAQVLHLPEGKEPRVSLEELEAAIRGDLRIFFLGEKLPLQLTPVEKDAYERAKAVHYVVGGGRRRNLLEAWYHWCWDMYEPHVEILLGRRFATVRLDMSTTRQNPFRVMDLTDAAWAEVEQLLDKEREHCREYWYGDGEAGCKRISPERAEAVAAALSTIAHRGSQPDWKEARYYIADHLNPERYGLTSSTPVQMTEEEWAACLAKAIVPPDDAVTPFELWKMRLPGRGEERIECRVNWYAICEEIERRLAEQAAPAGGG